MAAKSKFPAADVDAASSRPAAADAETPSVSESIIEARVLVDGAYGNCNEVVTLPASLVATLGGIVDPNPDAVAYVKSLTKE